MRWERRSSRVAISRRRWHGEPGGRDRQRIDGQVAVAGKNAIGKRIRVGRPDDQRAWPWMTVIGVVANMKRYTLTETPRPEMILRTRRIRI